MRGGLRLLGRPTARDGNSNRPLFLWLDHPYPAINVKCCNMNDASKVLEGWMDVDGTSSPAAILSTPQPMRIRHEDQGTHKTKTGSSVYAYREASML